MMKVIARLAERGVEAVTVYAYSSENFARPSSETAAILSVVTGWNAAYDGNMKVTYMGDFSRFPQAVADSIAEIERRTAANTGMRLNIALGYGGTSCVPRQQPQGAGKSHGRPLKASFRAVRSRRSTSSSEAAEKRGFRGLCFTKPHTPNCCFRTNSGRI